MGNSYLKKRRQGWYFQISVPTRLRKALGKATITASLQTRDLTVAQARRWPKLIEAQEAFAKLEGVQFSAAEPLDPEALLEIDEFARATYREALTKMQADARRGVRITADPKGDNKGHPNAREMEGLNKWSSELWLCGELDTYAPVAEPLAAYCERQAIVVGSELYKLAGRALLHAHIMAAEGRRRALKGEISDEPKTFLAYEPIDPVSLKPLRVSARAGQLIFADVAARMMAQRQRDAAYALRAQTKNQYETTYRLFDRWAHHPALSDIDKRKAAEFLDAITSLSPHWGRAKHVNNWTFEEIMQRFGSHTPGLSAVTLNRHSQVLGMVWDFAESRYGYEGKNPWRGQARVTTKRRGNSETNKRSFTAVEIGSLLDRRPPVAVRTHDYATALPWIVLVGAYSGMRLNEICELAADDVKEAVGIWYFNVTASKTEAGRRIVPVHSKILAAGFLEYRDSVKGGSLWPGIGAGGPDKKRRWYVTKHFVRYRRGLGLIDIDKVTGRDRLDFHSLRRSAITALKHARIPEHEVAELVGHEYPHVTFGVYPDRQRLDRLKAVVEAIRYDY